MKRADMQSLYKRINEFKARKAEKFPELDLRACTDYENYHLSQYPRVFRASKQLIKRY